MKFKFLREQKGLTQTELAKQLNINRLNYNKYELEDVEPKIEVLCKIADFYGVTLDFLCEHKTPYKQDLGYLDDKTLAILKLTQELTDKNKDQAFYYISGLVAGQ